MRNFALTIFIFSLMFSLSFAQNEPGKEKIDNKTASELKDIIEKKNAELQEIQAQREVLEKELETINNSGKTLKKDLQVVSSQINQLNLSIKANKLTVEKLELEIDSLNGDIKKIGEGIKNKKTTISKLMFELQQKDKENLLTILLKNKSLSETVFEVQTISKLNNGLVNSMGELKNLQDELVQKVETGQQKKKTREIESVVLINRQNIVQDQKNEKQKILEETKNQEKIYQQQISELEKKQIIIGEEIGKIEDQLRLSFDSSLLPIRRPGVLTYPVINVLITQGYGNTKFAERAYKTKFHNGIDFNASIGTPILASTKGKVIAVGNNGRLQYGKYILIEHKNNLATLYAHLSKYSVQKGDTVNEGDVIGYSGATGYSTGPHLHFTVYWAPSVTLKSFPGAGLVPVGITIDPTEYL